MKSRRTFTLRLEDGLLKKLHVASEKNKRSVNNQIECLIEEFISDFESEHGQVVPSDEE